MTDVPLRERRRKFEAEWKTMGKPREDRGRGSSDVFISQGAPRIASSLQKLGERHGMDLLPESPEGTNTDKVMVLDFWPLQL